MLHFDIQKVINKNFEEYPKFRHNLWTSFEDTPDETYLTASCGTFSVPTGEAQEFMSIRGLCTGHHSIRDISEKSSFDENKVRAIVTSLADAGISRRAYIPFDNLSNEEVQDTLDAACRIWSEQMSETGIAVDIQEGVVELPVVIGWLLEQYHYIRDFPGAVSHAAKHATGELKEVLQTYADQERGHEEFVLRTLLNFGVSRAEVENSIPLTSTRLIGFLSREMYEQAPCSALLLAAIVEASELEDDDFDHFNSEVARHYNVGLDALGPLQEHMRIDDDLDHAELPQRYRHLISFKDEDTLNSVVNQLHDIKHAFDLQKLEIKSYYAQTGNYFPRQFVDFFAI